ncbi:DeoR/GlpR family transcriptional regulator of sugar metabolism [Paenarthrobacter nicotinovorans]|jgi:DeoR/GlpR family transcriptional regulator of sugar metabolism|uniref:DeoR/GlpR family transcriptional regulator of sugar metabolism n=1 Tax=Paenarthrobacter nicotinovorans TaxID=29320 RepID=A0ABT9TN29_PAENI|nr:DeoR/GlpR family DNA-binding transcription regulator [Paenarthrobacter nicotinovorans]MDQ0103074.1 DeoR/GlpR family transcriptional regulator of sugar metabolism [Paenarthrobacter nicotinovorans]
MPADSSAVEAWSSHVYRKLAYNKKEAQLLPAARRAKLLAELNRAGSLSTDALAERLGVSGETVRRDIALLENEGQLARVHGGAMTLPAAALVKSEEPYDVRQDEHREAKVRVGQAAVSLVKNGDMIGLDVGTTSLQIAKALPAEFHGVVATPCLLVAAELAGRPNVDVLLSGGLVRGGDLACSNAQAVAFFRDLNMDVAFLSAGGLTAHHGLTDFYRDEVATRQEMLRSTARAYIAADASKMGKVAPYRVCDLGDVDGLVTDIPPAEALARELARQGVQLVLPPLAPSVSTTPLRGVNAG